MECPRAAAQHWNGPTSQVYGGAIELPVNSMVLVAGILSRTPEAEGGDLCDQAAAPDALQASAMRLVHPSPINEALPQLGVAQQVLAPVSTGLVLCPRIDPTLSHPCHCQLAGGQRTQSTHAEAAQPCREQSRPKGLHSQLVASRVSWLQVPRLHAVLVRKLSPCSWVVPLSATQLASRAPELRLQALRLLKAALGGDAWRLSTCCCSCWPGLVGAACLLLLSQGSNCCLCRAAPWVEGG